MIEKSQFFDILLNELTREKKNCIKLVSWQWQLRYLFRKCNESCQFEITVWFSVQKNRDVRLKVSYWNKIQDLYHGGFGNQYFLKTIFHKKLEKLLPKIYNEKYKYLTLPKIIGSIFGCVEGGELNSVLVHFFVNFKKTSCLWKKNLNFEQSLK